MGNPVTVILITAAGFLALVVALVASRRLASRLAGAATVLAALGGFFSYGYGFACQIPNAPLASLRSVLACLGMFLGSSDFSAVSDTPFFSSYPAQILFWFLHLLALYATAEAALIAIGDGALRRLRILLFHHRDLDLIFGSDQDCLSFGSRLVLRRDHHGLIFADNAPGPGPAKEIAAMGAVLRADPDSLAPNDRFLRSIGMRPGRRKLTVYAMQKDPVRNLRYASELLAALERRGIAPAQTRLVLSGAEEDDAAPLQALGAHYGYGSVTAFDSAALVARLLVREHPPCGTIRFDGDGRAAEDFEALVIGFGQIGQVVLRQLVMQGQFEGSHFRLAVFAPDCQQVDGCLASCSRGMMEQYDISLYPFDARSRELYSFLDQRGKSLKYIAVCAGDTRRNREIANGIVRFLSRIRSDAPVYQCSYQGIVSRSAADLPSEQTGIYTPEILCPDALDQMAMALNQCYCAGNGLSAQENWARCDYFSRLSSRASADFIPAMIRAAGKTREQVLAGSWDLTGRQLENLSRTEHLRWCAFHFAMGFEPMSPEMFAQRCARCREETARGGSFRVGKDMEGRFHACLIPWEELDGLSRAENAVTGGSVDYKALDRNNVLILPQVLRASLTGDMRETGRDPR